MPAIHRTTFVKFCLEIERPNAPVIQRSRSARSSRASGQRQSTVRRQSTPSTGEEGNLRPGDPTEPPVRTLGVLPFDDQLLQGMLNHLDDLLGALPPAIATPALLTARTNPQTALPTGADTIIPNRPSEQAIIMPSQLPPTSVELNHIAPADHITLPLQEMQVVATIFIGLSRGGNLASAVRSNITLDHPTHAKDVLELLMASSAFPGRALSKYPVNNDIWVGTSRRPIDIESGTHQNHSTHFHDIGTLLDVLSNPAMRSRDVLEPAEDCTARTDLLNLHDLPMNERVFVLYVYEDVG